ncbi:MAG: TrkH family potassium uptake protein [Acidimicrobiia bacterium]|nr:MAG: TrkH family potassium uptake protein [Acidimicrobiia bacterium]
MPVRHSGWSVPPTPRHVAYIVGVVLVGSGFAMLPSAVVGLLYREWGPSRDLTVSAAVTIVIGAAMVLWAGRPHTLTPKQAFASVAVAWISVVFFGALPLLLSGTISGVTDAVFESTAGFTTTGSTVISDLSSVANAILLWRATTQWLGGMGIIVLSIAVLPLIGAGGVQLARAEAPGPEPERLTPRFQGTALRLWGVYVAFTVIAAILLTLGDMSLFEGVAHALTSVSTGGFSTASESIGAFSAYTQWVVIFFMFVAGMSFALHYRALSNPAEYATNSEFRLYVAIVIVAAVLVLAGFAIGDVADNTGIRDGIFTTLTLVTGTGYTTTNFAAWGPRLLILLMLFMFLGGMAGSTTGGMKTYRVGLLAKSSGADLRAITRPQAVNLTRFGGVVVPASVLRNVSAYFFLYIGIFVGGSVLLSFFEALSGNGIDVASSTSAAASALSNVGPALGELGPTSTYATVVTPGKWLLAFMMIVGRLEIFPILLLFTPAFWRR